MSPATPFEMVSKQSTWYGDSARTNQSRFMALKTSQIVIAAAIPVVSVAAVGETQKWTNAVLGALIGIIEGILQLRRYQQNWLLYRATREALKREELLHTAKAGPYAGVADPDTLYFQRVDAITSGENTKWLSSQEQSGSKKDDAKG